MSTEDGDHDLTLFNDPVRRHQWGRASRIVALNVLALLASNQQYLEQAEWAAHTALRLARRVGDLVGCGYALGMLGRCAQARGDPDRGIVLHEESLSRARDSDDLAGIWRALNVLGGAVGARGELDRAENLHEESLVIARRLGCPWQRGASLRELGRLAYRRGAVLRAVELLEESLDCSRLVRSTRGPHQTLALLGAIDLRQGNMARAMDRFSESLTLCHAAGDRAGMARGLDSIATAWAAYAQQDLAGRGRTCRCALRSGRRATNGDRHSTGARRRGRTSSRRRDDSRAAWWCCIRGGVETRTGDDCGAGHRVRAECQGTPARPGRGDRADACRTAGEAC